MIKNLSKFIGLFILFPSLCFAWGEVSYPALKSTAPGRGADLVGGAVKSVDTIAALRLISGATEGQLVQVAGYYTAGDGGGGPTRRWDAASVCTDDGGACIDPAAAGAGRWVFSQRDINILWYGVEGGSADDTQKIRNAVNYGSIIYGDGETEYLVSTRIDIKSNTTLKKMNFRAVSSDLFTQGYPFFGAIFTVTLASNVTVDNCSFTVNGSFSGNIINVDKSDKVEIKKNKFSITESTWATAITVISMSNNIRILANTIEHHSTGATDGGGAIWVRNLVAVGNVVDYTENIIVDGNIINKTSKDEAIWITGNNGITKDIKVRNNTLTVSGAGSAISVFPGVFATGGLTTTVKNCSIHNNTITGSLSDTAIKIGNASDTGASLYSINVTSNKIDLSSALFGIRRDTITLVDSKATDNFVSIGGVPIAPVQGFTFSYNNIVAGNFSNDYLLTYPVNSASISYGTYNNPLKDNSVIDYRAKLLSPGKSISIKLSGGYSGESKFAGIKAAPFFANANGMRIYLISDGVDIAYATDKDNSGAVAPAFLPAANNAVLLGSSTYRWSIINAGSINLNSLATYTDNAAAVAAGKAAGFVYRTPTGVLMVVY